MGLNYNPICVECLTFSGNNVPGETLLIFKLPYLCPRDEKTIKAAILPMVVEMIKQFEEKEALEKENKFCR